MFYISAVRHVAAMTWCDAVW